MRRHLALALSLLVPLETLAESPSARVLDRYREMLRSQPVDGTALDRLWKAYADAGKSTDLLHEYEAAADSFAGKMVLGHLHRRAGDDLAAARDYTLASTMEPSNPLPLSALGKLHADRSEWQPAIEAYFHAAQLLGRGSGQPPTPQLTDVLTALGSAYLAADQIDLAAEAWEQIAAAAPDNLELRRRLADQYLASHLPERAIPHLEYLGAHGPPSDRPQALQRLATVHQAAGRADDAIRVLETALSITARGNWLRPEVEGQLIRLYQRFGRSVELEQRWKKYLADNPRDAGAYLQLAELYHRLGDLEQERSTVEGLVKLLPKNAEYRLRLARLLTRSDHLPEAAVEYETLLKEQPANTDLVFERAELEIRQDQTAAARARVKALLAEKGRGGESAESLRAKGLEFFREHRLLEDVEATLRQEASAGTPETSSALSQFLFSQHRDAEAEQILRQQVRRSDAKPVQAAALLQASSALKQQNLLRPALQAATEAADLAGDDTARRREALLAQGELHLALGEHEAAREAVEQAATLAATFAETVNTDQRLFEILRQIGERDAAKQPRVGPGGIASIGEPEQNPALSAYEARLRTSAEQSATADGWLRVARWQSWCRNARAANDSVQRALTVNPNSIPAHEFAVKLAAGEAPGVAAQQHLEKLMALDPANITLYQRRLAQLEQQSGQFSLALTRFEAIAHEHPGDPEILAELATAQQAAEQWDAAFQTWKRVHALSPPARKRESLAPLLRISERTGQHRAAAELLLGEIDASTELKEKRELFADLLTLCSRRGLLPWLRSRWDQRRQRQPDDFFLETSLAEILKSDGDRQAAFETLSRALFTAPDPAAALPELVRQAEELRRYEAAIDFQARLTRLGPQDRPANFLKLAELQERDFDIPGTEKTYAQVTHRFPRDPEALRRAIDFHWRLGHAPEAAELLRRLRGVEGPSVATTYQLAQLDLEMGRTDEAERGFEEILRSPAPPIEGEPFVFPALKPGNAGKLQSDYLAAVRHRRGRPSAETMQSLRGFWIDSPMESNSERDRRLRTVQELTALLRSKEDPATLTRWIERWQQADDDQANEALWAFFFAGAEKPALELLERLMEKDPGNEALQQGYLWMALQLGGFDRLGAWNQDRRRTLKQRDFFRIALSQFLRGQGPRLPAGLVDGLFPAGARTRLWEGAELCAGNGSFREALALGQRSLAVEDPDRGEHRLQLAHWQICLGELQPAQKALTALAHSPAELLERPTFIALREAWLLLPEADRKPFADRLEHELEKSPSPVHQALARLLLAGLQNDRPLAQAELKALLAMRVTVARPSEESDQPGSTRLTPGGRSWSFLLSTGMNLQVWKLDGLAASLWDQALADRAMLRLEGDQAQELAREARARLFALKLARSERGQYDDLLEEYGRGVQQLEGAVVLGENLESAGALPPALAVYRRLWEKDSGNNQPLRNVLNLCRALDDAETTESILTRCVQERLFAQNENVQRDLVLQLVDVIERRQDYPAAHAALRQALDASPFDTRLLQREAQLFEHANRPVDAETVWRRVLATEPANAAGRLGLATLLENQGKFGAAITILQKNSPPGSETQLARLCVLDGQVEEAAGIVEHLTGPPYLAAVDAIASAMLSRGQVKPARHLLQTAIARTPEPGAAMPAQAQILESLKSSADAATVQRELRKLRRMAGDDPGRVGVYFSHATRLAAALHVEKEVAAELEAAWADGGGLFPAGLALISWKAERQAPETEAILKQIIARRDLPVETMTRLVEILIAAKRPDLAARVQEILVPVLPLDDDQVIKLAMLLSESGRSAEAVAALEKWGARAVLSDDFAVKVASAWIKLGFLQRAEPLLAQITTSAFARTPEPYLVHARLRLALGDSAGARRLLREAFRFPANRSFEDLVAWARAAQKLESPEEIASTFQLTAAQTTAYHGALFTDLEKAKEAVKAAAFLAAHPASLRPGFSARLRTLATGRNAFAEAAAAFDVLLAQAATLDEVSREYALLLDAWADSDSLGGRPADALAHLTRATELQPDSWPLTEKLTKALVTANDSAKARATLQHFLLASKDSADREKANRLMGELR